MNKKVVITGGAGFIGSHLARRLLSGGCEVHLLDDFSNGLAENVPDKAILHRLDLSDEDALFTLDFPPQVDCVFHLAAQSSGEASFDDPLRDMKVNYIATYNILKLAAMRKCRRFVFTSSMSVYGDACEGSETVSEEHSCEPVSYYGCNKLASEKLIGVFAQKEGMDFTIFRPFNVYGPGQNMLNLRQGMISIYLSYLMREEPVQVKGSLSRFRDFIYIEDVVDALIGSLDGKAYSRKVFNLGTSVKTTVRELLAMMLKVYGKDDFDKWVKVEGETAGDIKGVVSDISRIKKDTGWSPKYGLEKGLISMKGWLDDTAALWKGRLKE